MKTHQIKINLPFNTYLSDIEPFKTTGIPSNSIIHKVVPGCGITTFEFQYAKHHSIIILPNVPVIKTKVAEHNKNFPDQEILGVHKGIDIHDIKVYLLKDKVKFKKILTTPEGFINKVMKVFENNLNILYDDFFLVFDECERIITDVSYRGAIAAPLDLFFLFKNKALVSATTLPFSDERFDNFSHYIITPDYTYSQPLTLVNTNNVLASTKSRINELSGDHVFIFINSTNGIHAITEQLGIYSESKAFCAQESVAKLMLKKYMNASDEFDVKDMARYNLFTSRYFSAVDIKLDYKPDVIMITDIFFADHSILDPHTEIIQIAGRFRNGVNSLTHITNYNPNMVVKTQQEALTYRFGCLDTYEQVVKLFTNSTNQGAKDTLEFFKKNSPMASFYSNGKRNSFMIDNDLNEERVKGYYLSKDNLKAAYDEIVSHFSVNIKEEDYHIHDDDMYVLIRCETKVERNKHLATLISRYTLKPGAGNLLLLSKNSEELKNILINKNPLVAEAVRLVGLPYLERHGFDTKSLQKTIYDAKKANKWLLLAPYVHEAFQQDTIMSESIVLYSLVNIYSQKRIKDKACAAHIRHFFEVKRTTKEGQNVYLIGKKKEVLPIHEM